MKRIDLRSDTATIPSEEMMEAMRTASFGDDLLGENATVIELERLAATLLGKEAAMLVISGSMANQIAVMVLAERGQEVILGKESHLFNLEVAGLAALSQVQARPVSVVNGHYRIDEMEESIKQGGIQAAETGLISLENTYNLNEGAVVTLENMVEIKELADDYRIPVYLDGARLFNAAAYLDVHPADICQTVDAVQFCLTKGLGCPLGSLLVGSKSFIQKAKRIRQRLGGGMRQAGMIAAPGIIGLTQIEYRMRRDNQLATNLFKGLRHLHGIRPTAESFQTNIVSIEVVKDGWDADRLIAQLQNAQIFVKKIGRKQVRMVMHSDVSNDDIETVIRNFQEVLK